MDAAAHTNDIELVEFNNRAGQRLRGPVQDATINQAAIIERQNDDCATRYPVPQRLFRVTGETEGATQYERHDNPFGLWTMHEIRTVGQRVACEYGLEEMRHVFIKATLAMAKPDEDDWDWTNVNGISEGEKRDLQPTAEEKEVLRGERTKNFWNQPWPLKTTMMMLFVAASVQGWTQTATNGGNLTWPEDLGVTVNSTLGANATTPIVLQGGASSTANCKTFTGINAWKFGAINAAPYLFAVIGSLFSDWINEVLMGRRAAIALSAFFVFFAAMLGAFAVNYWWLFFTRMILGFGMGCKAAVTPVFAAEIAPTHMRGQLVMNWQVFDAFGILLGFSANLAASTQGSTAWRWQIASSAVPAFVLLWSVVYVCWDSPRFLMKHEERFRSKYNARRAAYDKQQQNAGQHKMPHRASTLPRDVATPTAIERAFSRVQRLLSTTSIFAFRRSPPPRYRSEAYRTLILLREEPILAAKELVFAHCQLLVETMESQPRKKKNMEFSLQRASSWRRRVVELITRGYIRREMYAAAVVMISQQLCGINVLIFYSSTLYCGLGGGDALWQTWGVGLTNVLFALPAYAFIDRTGRRPLLLATLPFMAIAMGIASASFRITDQETRKRTLTAFTYIFTALYSPGMGPVPFTLSAEVFPLEHRMVGMSLAVALNFLGAGLLTLFFPHISASARVLGIFAGLNVLAWILVWIYVREPTRDPASTESTRMTSLSLEELFKVFRYRTITYIKYQCLKVLPYQLQWLFRVETSQPEPFTEFGEKDEERRSRKRSNSRKIVGSGHQ